VAPAVFLAPALLDPAVFGREAAFRFGAAFFAAFLGATRFLVVARAAFFAGRAARFADFRVAARRALFREAAFGAFRAGFAFPPGRLAAFRLAMISLSLP
jgi:hypothetical protein